MRSRSHAAGLLAAFVVAAPVLVGIAYSTVQAFDLSGSAGGPSVGPERLVRVLSERTVWRGTIWSLWIAAVSTALSAVAAGTLAIAFRGHRGTDRLARGLALIPLPIPHVVAGLLALLVLGQSGLLARVGYAAGLVAAPAAMPALVYDPLGIGAIIALVWKEIPFLALIAFSILAASGRRLEETARTLGASSSETLRRVTIPLLWRGMLPGIVAVFAFAFGSYEIVALLAPSEPLPLPLLMMERHTGPALSLRGDAFVLALLAISITAAVVACHEWVRADWERFEP